jgi:hypothetical protein
VAVGVHRHEPSMNTNAGCGSSFGRDIAASPIMQCQ